VSPRLDPRGLTLPDLPTCRPADLPHLPLLPYLPYLPLPAPTCPYVSLAG
jgi:hypothetical protein